MLKIQPRDFNIITNNPSAYHSWRIGNSGSIPPISRQVLTAPTLRQKIRIHASSRGNKRNIESADKESCLFEQLPGYDRQIESKIRWGERQIAHSSLFNSSSVKYDFINQTKHRKVETAMETRKISKSCNRKKGITELSDLNRLHHPKPHEDYQQLYKSKPFIFRKQRGLFSNYLDRAHRTGSLSKPFQKYKFY